MSNRVVIDFASVWTNVNRLPAEVANDRVLPGDDALCAEVPRLRRLVHRLLGWSASAHDIDDVVQDALLAAFRHREQFRGDAKMTTWLTRFALSKAKNHARSAKLRRSLFSLFGASEVVAEAAQSEAGKHEQLDRTKLALARATALVSLRNSMPIPSTETGHTAPPDTNKEIR